MGCFMPSLARNRRSRRWVKWVAACWHAAEQVSGTGRGVRDDVRTLGLGCSGDGTPRGRLIYGSQLRHRRAARLLDMLHQQGRGGLWAEQHEAVCGLGCNNHRFEPLRGNWSAVDGNDHVARLHKPVLLGETTRGQSSYTGDESNVNAHTLWTASHRHLQHTEQGH